MLMTIATATLVLMSGLLVFVGVTTLPSANAESDGAGCGHGSSGRNVPCAATDDNINPSGEGNHNSLSGCMREEASSGSVSCGP